jgi:hypothetical protein
LHRKIFFGTCRFPQISFDHIVNQRFVTCGEAQQTTPFSARTFTMRTFFTCSLLLLAAGFGFAADKPDEKKIETKKPTNANFEKMSKLVGTWVNAEGDKDQIVSVIKLTAGGSAIHETIFPGTPMEMVSVYTQDGDDLAMTHYCMLGNAPKMKADPKSPANKIAFLFDGGSNLDPAKDKHMHGATLTILDKDTIEIAGIAWEGGKPSAEMCGTMKLVRKK